MFAWAVTLVALLALACQVSLNIEHNRGMSLASLEADSVQSFHWRSVRDDGRVLADGRIQALDFNDFMSRQLEANTPAIPGAARERARKQSSSQTQLQ